MNEDKDKHRHESLASGMGMRGEIRQELDEQRKLAQRDRRKEKGEDPFSNRKPGQPRRSDADENLL